MESSGLSKTINLRIKFEGFVPVFVYFFSHMYEYNLEYVMEHKLKKWTS